MTAQHIREALKAARADGLVWDEIVHQVNTIAGRRVLTLPALRRFVLDENQRTREATLYWLEKFVALRQSPEASR